MSEPAKNEAMNGWPDPERLGVPLHPERDGIHWLFNPDNDNPHPVMWVADLGAWAVGDAWTPRIVAEMGLHYLGPVLMPAEADALRAENARLREALKNLLDRDERNTCQHEETHRGGFLWEICDVCGAKWADDMGGKTEWKDPPEWVSARAALEVKP
jgi:hypothetical protein